MVFPPDHVYNSYFEPCQVSAQYKKLFVIVLALSKVEAPINLFSDNLYVVNLLAGLAQAKIRLDDNPIIPHDVSPKVASKVGPSPINPQGLMSCSRRMLTIDTYSHMAWATTHSKE